MSETTIMKGALEDHLGRIIYPDTEADQVMTGDGKTVEEKLAELLANFANYLPLTGGRLNGNLWVGGKMITLPNFGTVMCTNDGTVLFGCNVYLHTVNNTYHYMATHASMGAKGIVMRFGQPGIWYFDTGSIATVANAEFTPNLVSITDKATKLHSGNDLNNITDNALIDGNTMANAPDSDWFYVQHFTHSQNKSHATQIAYAFFTSDVYRRRKDKGVWTPWEPFMTQSNTPTQHYSTVAPTASDGNDGDVWDVYV